MNEKKSTLQNGGSLAGPTPFADGIILSDPQAQVRKMTNAYRIIRERTLTQGRDSIYNLTGLVRAFPLDPEDLPALSSEMGFIAYFEGRAEPLAIEHMGADPKYHDAVVCNRVTAGMIGIMLALVKKGDRVLSLVPAGRSHPSVQKAVELAGGSIREVQGMAALEEALEGGSWNILVITPITPQKYHLPAVDVGRAIALAKDLGMLVVADDAHMTSRMFAHNEAPTFGLGEFDAGVWSLDKHFPGPRSGVVVGSKDLLSGIRSAVFEHGLEAQSGHYVAGLRAMESFDPQAIRDACDLGRQLLERLQKKYGKAVYPAGPGVAISAEDLHTIVLKRANTGATPLIPGEVSTAACFDMLNRYGIVTICVTGMPGASPTFRLLMHPDGHRLGVGGIEEATEVAIDTVAGLLNEPEKVSQLILGAD